MVCRTWSARCARGRVGEYEAIARDRVLADLRRVPGFRGAVLLKRRAEAAGGDAGEVSLLFLTFWESMDAVRGFAGDDPSRAVVLPEAEAVLTQADHVASHWDLVVNTGLAAGR